MDEVGCRGLEVLLVAVGVARLFTTQLPLVNVLLLISWDGLAVVFCLVRWLRVRRARRTG
ncbi:hypothetical protein [Amycolatopsis sp. FDAARGOS 1241]|uniref:hypothetical protein n=1 Tax=Amycolatopsis sp. FDAARGOS 1241 TaxID=2778070 RepID=UPI00194F3ADB|nr:hypothetical protein [Amycolatopsis sp. FDAARGOS 1241]QRP43174.1 hypothetical protein I6J71_27520 [Amycolatopsis sp. FDAARGOS 1241]